MEKSTTRNEVELEANHQLDHHHLDLDHHLDYHHHHHHHHLYMPLHASSLTAIVMKGSPNSSERDAGFCSGSSEGGDDLSMDHARLETSNPTSPTDSTQDSVDVVSIVRNKRKSTEPAKIVDDVAAAPTNTSTSATDSTTTTTNNSSEHCTDNGAHTRPLKKRIRYTSTADSAVALTPPAIVSPPPTMTRAIPLPLPLSSPSAMAAPTTATAARTAIEATIDQSALETQTTTQQHQPQLWKPYYSHYMPNPAEVTARHAGVTTLHRASSDHDHDVAIGNGDFDQQEPLNLVLAKPADDNVRPLSAASPPRPELAASTSSSVAGSSRCSTSSMEHAAQPLAPAPAASPLPIMMASRARCASVSTECSLPADDTMADATATHAASNCATSTSGHSQSNNGHQTRPQQRNYKNMTRERRIEANARERTRVHTISAAYETLRHAVPSYSNAQKLSKLSVLRIACTYILALSRMAGHDYSHDQSEPSVDECMDALTATIQAEGKIQKKKKDGE